MNKLIKWINGWLHLIPVHYCSHSRYSLNCLAMDFFMVTKKTKPSFNHLSLTRKIFPFMVRSLVESWMTWRKWKTTKFYNKVTAPVLQPLTSQHVTSKRSSCHCHSHPYCKPKTSGWQKDLHI
jgi:hypothetical protein